jgi:single-strand DNA-binding protein
MANLNKVLLMGNLTRDPELRYTPSGTPVCEFGLAINRRYADKAGEQKDETCYVDVTMWGKRGVVISEYFTKGQPIFIEGRLKYDSWDSAEGRRSKLSVVVQNFEFVGSRGGAGTTGRGGGRTDRRSSEPPRSNEQEQEPPEAEPDVKDDEIPF